MNTGGPAAGRSSVRLRGIAAPIGSPEAYRSREARDVKLKLQKCKITFIPDCGRPGEGKSGGGPYWPTELDMDAGGLAGALKNGR